MVGIDFDQIMALRQASSGRKPQPSGHSSAAKRRLQRTKPTPQGNQRQYRRAAPSPTPNPSSITAPADPIRKLPPDIAAMVKKYGRA